MKKSLVREIAADAESFSRISFDRVIEEANFLTDALASHGHSLGEIFQCYGSTT